MLGVVLPLARSGPVDESSHSRVTGIGSFSDTGTVKNESRLPAVVALGVEAHGHAQPHRAEVAMVIYEPVAQTTRDDRQDGVVDRGPVLRLRGVVQGWKGTVAKATRRRVPMSPSNGGRWRDSPNSLRMNAARWARRRSSSAACAGAAIM